MSTARTFSGTAGTDTTNCTFQGNPPKVVTVSNYDASIRLMVNIPSIHGSAFAYVGAGKDRVYKSNGGIGQIIVKAESGTVAYSIDINEGPIG